ncbi:MAG TPA: NUDIX domain-containing protein, partial [Bacteroidales bacterium]|nr:NUDIX domain-containing protein [Bacteroidales bacterium]
MTIFPITVFDEIGSQIIENEEIFKAFLQNYEYMCAAGGVVVNDNDEILMIFRKNRWDFPKGKVENGEPISVAAQREVNEETGVNATIIDDIPLSTFHLYQFGT